MGMDMDMDMHMDMHMYMYMHMCMSMCACAHRTRCPRCAHAREGRRVCVWAGRREGRAHATELDHQVPDVLSLPRGRL